LFARFMKLLLFDSVLVVLSILLLLFFVLDLS
jgi:hypothetical protein